MTAEHTRLAEDRARTQQWKRWGPYLSERQSATVREDYSADGNCWQSFPHEHARSRAYRWGEDGLLGFTDRQCRLCFGLALWNGEDPILKERLFGLTGPEGNHGEDVKECYYYIDSTPTHSYAKALYKYPQAAFPYEKLVRENAERGREVGEFELEDTGVFDENRYFDVVAEYAKAGPEDICIRLTLSNRGPDAATLHVLPSLWFRNTWSWGREAADQKPSLHLAGDHEVKAIHPTLGEHRFTWEGDADVLFTENETNYAKLYGGSNAGHFVKDAFHQRVILGRTDVVNPAQTGTKCAPHFILELAPGEERVLKLRLTSAELTSIPAFDEVFTQRISEADEFYGVITNALSTEARHVARQAYAGLLWSKQFYHYIIKEWLSGDPAFPPPPAERLTHRNAAWRHLHASDVISMPDKWEYPWFAAWDLAFHMVAMAEVDPDFAKAQLELFVREWYMHPNGQLPAYEFEFNDVNPPVHAWAAWRVYKMSGPRGERDRVFLESVFQKLLINFTWWVNRKDEEGNNLFAGGFLGLDNIGVFDRNLPLPGGGELQQADGTAWMASYCLTMLAIALELAMENHVYEDMASKFFEHFVTIADAMNNLGGFGLWDEQDGFYYDQIIRDGQNIPLRIQSMVGLIPLIAVEVFEEEQLKKLPGFSKRMHWFIEHRPDLAEQITWCQSCAHQEHRILAIPTRARLERTLQHMLDEEGFLSPHGLRSISRHHLEHPYVFDENHRVQYVPGESTTGTFGGNSNWRGPIWFPINYLLIEALERYAHFYGKNLQVADPAGSGKLVNLDVVAQHLAARLSSLFLPDAGGHRPCHAGSERYAKDPHWKDLVLFHEYFHGDTGRGCGASHQTGWTALVVRCLDNDARLG
jgi:Glycosyl hydrolase family 63 C-terminal domain